MPTVIGDAEMKCFLNFNHQWGKWSSIYEDYNGKQWQFRKCIKCGKAEKRKVGWLIGLSMNTINEELYEY